MMADMYFEIFDWYPNLILVSDHPVTWEGLLTTAGQTNLKHRLTLKIKLEVPNYPTLTGAKLLFGRTIGFLRTRELDKKISNLLNTTSTVLSFLRRLQMLFDDLIYCSSNTKIYTDGTFKEGTLEDLKNVLCTHSGMKLSSNRTFDFVKLYLKGVHTTLTKDTYYLSTWKVVSSDLPELTVDQQKTLTLGVAMKKLEDRVQLLEDIWHQLSQIDRNCWVIDPQNPKPYHLYRRINLSQSLSVLVTLDPLNSSALPDIKLFGTNAEVQEYECRISQNLQNWDLESSLLDNLQNLLCLNEFPRASTTKCNPNQGGIIEEEECCICFSLTLDEGQLPDKICDNEKCRRKFHVSCLFQWLQTTARNNIVFNHIHGVCPNCGENISCSAT
ncbi:uncharacterized protein LOC105694477 [Orussus abietinus]|uniref:uncharacterized protein LOC105694477 n=1 Tax=Orussus abietinus TaxID=222816 RepID=UPI00062591EB|nr:uncharacterized protein LOC105694477 [Orussus abietinus]XP_012270595.1 uncharacterized protein LOC105694477 [Orussus abietinus]